MRLTLDPVEDLEGVRHDWASLAERAGNPFLTWEWASTWWHHFGAGRKLRATACRAPDGEVRAILPLYEAAVRPVRVLRLMGHGPGDHLGLLCSPDDREDAGSALRELLSVDPRPWDVLLAERLPSDEGWAAAVGGEVLVRESESRSPSISSTSLSSCRRVSVTLNLRIGSSMYTHVYACKPITPVSAPRAGWLFPRGWTVSDSTPRWRACSAFPAPPRQTL